jgi:hypothetical protein
MPKGYSPTVFVSSTCYDLSQVRLDLKEFIEKLGYEAMISESSAFPVNPQSDTFDNCITAVRDRADIFVLIIGNRFGSSQGGGRSITNLEYLEAKAKRIPIYIFVSNGIIHNLKVWKKNPQGDFSEIVDDPKLFLFVEELRSGQIGNWVYGFDEVKNIIETLRKQWAILFTESLLVRKNLQSNGYSKELLSLPAESLRILLEKPFGWEFRLLTSVIKSEFASLSVLKRDVRYGLLLKAGKKLDGPSEVMGWISAQMGRILKFTQTSSKIINIAFPEAIGPKGQPGDPELIVYIGQRFAELSRQILLWKLEFSEVIVDEEFEKILGLVSAACDEQLEKFELFSDELDAQLDAAHKEHMNGKTEPHINVQITLGDPFSEEFSNEMNRLNLLFLGERYDQYEK